MSPVVELLTFAGCPNHERAAELVRRVAPDAELRVVMVEDEEDARRLRFTGSPQLRVDGRDLEPDTGAYALACRVYDEAALERRLREALS